MLSQAAEHCNASLDVGFGHYVSDQMMDYASRVRLTKKHRKNIAAAINHIDETLDSFKPPVKFKIILFGSIASGLATSESDLDLRLEAVPASFTIKKSTLRQVAYYLRDKRYNITKIIAHARVPIIKFIEPML